MHEISFSVQTQNKYEVRLLLIRHGSSDTLFIGGERCSYSSVAQH